MKIKAKRTWSMKFYPEWEPQARKLRRMRQLAGMSFYDLAEELDFQRMALVQAETLICALTPQAASRVEHFLRRRLMERMKEAVKLLEAA
jgi:ribosome-binding protein aMBF1 (putative translation factor)